MAKEHGQEAKAGRREQDDAKAKSKRPYKTPHLTTYGNLRQLSLQKDGTKTDGGTGNPKSRM